MKSHALLKWSFLLALLPMLISVQYAFGCIEPDADSSARCAPVVKYTPAALGKVAVVLQTTATLVTNTATRVAGTPTVVTGTATTTVTATAASAITRTVTVTPTIGMTATLAVTPTAVVTTTPVVTATTVVTTGTPPATSSTPIVITVTTPSTLTVTPTVIGITSTVTPGTTPTATLVTPTFTPIVIPTPTKMPVATNPDNAHEPDGGWLFIAPGAKHWYKMADAGLQLEIWIDDNGQKGIDLAVFAPEQHDLYGTPIGRGSYNKFRPEHDLLWTGRTINRGTWYAYVTNISPNPISYSLNYQRVVRNTADRCSLCHGWEIEWDRCSSPGSDFCGDLKDSYGH